MASAWESSAEDFGQKVDLTVRIREILRNYPEGLSILKELIQNADDAGARTVRFVAAEARSSTSSSPQASATSTSTSTTTTTTASLSALMAGPSLLSYNSAKFTDTDFASIQRIGDSLKKDKEGTKTGRFGVGVNSTYHLTDVPVFVSGTKLVLFDPQACHVPGINPANPGKLIDTRRTNGRALVDSLPGVFDPLRIFGCTLAGDDFEGTTFRFALRTEEQAVTSRLSRQSHTLAGMRDLLNQMASAAPSMLLFLKNVECIEIYDWAASASDPILVHTTRVSDPSDRLRKRRSYVLNAPAKIPARPQPVDYILDIVSDGIGTVSEGGSAYPRERWIVCNQLGGGQATRMASDPALAHMRLVPWAGVAARLSPPAEVDCGSAYCFLPLPVRTKLPVMVNGYFELSSNRRDVWWGDDMDGDGRARAEWNRSLVEDVAGPSYCRLVAGAIKTKNVAPDGYESLFPQRPTVGPWQVLARGLFSGIRTLPVLYSESAAAPEHWVTPAACVLQHDEKDAKLTEILQLEGLPLVVLKSSELRAFLLEREACRTTSDPLYVREHFRRRGPRVSGEAGALEDGGRKIAFAEHLLRYCISDLDPSEYGKLAGCQLVPLASGNLGTFCSLPRVDTEALRQLEAMGYSKLSCMHALRTTGGSLDASFEWLYEHRFGDSSATVQHGVDPYLLCGGDGASILMTRASETFVDADKVSDHAMKKFFKSSAVSSLLNVLPLGPDMLGDVLTRVIPQEWKGAESSAWSSAESASAESNHPNKEWFASLWRYICSCNSVGESLAAVAEQYCIVPTQEGFVCNLSPGASVIIPSGLDQSVVEAIVGLGARTLLPGVLPQDIIVPEEIYSYIFQPTRDGVIKTIEAAIRRQTSRSKADAEGSHASLFDDISDELKLHLYKYIMNSAHGPISNEARAALKTFPIFQAHSDDYNTETVFVAPLQSGTWFVLEGADEHDKALMTSEFLSYKTSSEMEMLISILGAKRLSRPLFFRRFVLPQIADLEEEVRTKCVGRILIDLPTLCSKDPDFHSILATTAMIPTAETKTLKSPLELYDPEVPQLRALMSQDSFPVESFCSHQLILSLRSLGLQSTLTWDVVLDCARSVERDGGHTDGEIRSSAQERGKELLAFLDMNVGQFFPELVKKKKKSTTTRIFNKVNAALFDDSEKKKRGAEEQAERVSALLSIQWMPVHTEPPHPFLPWPPEVSTVAAPLATSQKDKMWLVSYSRRLVNGDVHSNELRKLFGWLDPLSVKDVACQLKMFDRTFADNRNKIMHTENRGDSAGSDERKVGRIPSTMNALCQTVTSEVPRIYQIINNVESEYEIDTVKSVLHGCAWLWMGDKFVKSDHCAFVSPINAMPYLYTVPPDIACFRNLLNIFGVRSTFRSSDFAMVLQRMAEEEKASDSSSWTSKQIDLAVGLVQAVSDDVMKLQDMEIYAPSENGTVVLASSLTYDDAPWLSKDLPSKKDLLFAHPKLSSDVSDKIGIKSLRSILVSNSSDMISFGDGVVHEAFGQSESLTRRLKNIIELYPEGTQQLSELVQNADDASATVVKFVVSRKQHGSSSLLGQKLSAWQGPALLCYNNATFSSRDFQNLARIGQASKLDKLVTTGRFGLGFNSVFHWTDVPSFVSGDHLVMFDPHARYVPGATNQSRGIKIRFANSGLLDQFPDQMVPYCLFGCDMKHRFNGTLFRFPFRTESTASESEISKNQFTDDEAMGELLERFRTVLPRFLLFLRHVKRIEVYSEGPGDEDAPQMLYYAEVTGRRDVMEKITQPVEVPSSSLGSLKSLAMGSMFTAPSVSQSNDWNAVSTFVSGPSSDPISKEEFYSKLQSTPEAQLPRTKHIVSIRFVSSFSGRVMLESANTSSMKSSGDDGGVEVSIEDRDNVNSDPPANSNGESFTDEYLVCSGLGGGGCRAMACNPEYRDMKFLPWGGIAARLTRNGKDAPITKGTAFCFLPLPTTTGLPVLINGYFELSANRRDIWYGHDMSGQGRVRSEWNKALLSDVISPMYAQLLLSASRILGPGSRYDKLWPVKVTSDVWKLVRSGVYQAAHAMPLFYSSLDGGRWVCPKDSLVLDATDGAETPLRLMNVLLKERLHAISIPSSIIRALQNEQLQTTEVTPVMVRTLFKTDAHHPSLQSRGDALFVLKYCMDDDLREGQKYHELIGLPLVPLCSGGLGRFQGNSSSDYFVPTKTERELLSNASEHLVDVWTEDETLNIVLQNPEIHKQTNVALLDKANIVRLLAYSFPSEWCELSEVRWNPSDQAATSSIKSEAWLSKLWDYIAFSVEDVSDSAQDLLIYAESWQILPTFVGEGERTLLRLAKDLAVVNVVNSSTGALAISDEVAAVLRTMGIRTLDTSVFDESNRRAILQKLEGFVQPPTVKGILRALVNSFPPDVDDSELIRRASNRFKFISDESRETLREFLRDNLDGSKASSSVLLDPGSIRMLRALPVFQVYGKDSGQTGPASSQYGDLIDEKFLPPLNTDPALLNPSFVQAVSKKDVNLLESLGVVRMRPSVFFELHASSKLSEGGLDANTRDSVVQKFLQDFPRLVDEEDGGVEWCERMSQIRFVPNRNGSAVKAQDLYDPNEADLMGLLDDSMLPSLTFCSGVSLAGLRMLGMRSSLTIEGVLDCARSIENEAVSKSSQGDGHNSMADVTNRAKALLNFLDREQRITTLLEEAGGINSTIVDNQAGEDSPAEYAENDFVTELNEITWLPVSSSNEHTDDSSTAPRKKRSGLAGAGFAAPRATRPQEDEWLCSSAMEILAVAVRSDALRRCFGWDKPVPIIVVASQLLALAGLHERRAESRSFRRTLATVIPRCYELLNSHLDSASIDERDRISMLLSEQNWLWVGDSFVTTSQVALDAPENARPFLFSVPSELRCFDNLLKACGVREKFSADDFVNLSVSLRTQLRGGVANQKEIDLAVFIARHLSRLPPEELAAVDKGKVFLPSKNGRLYRSVDMTYDDAPWLSAIVTGKARERYLFVHADVGNATARLLGARSLRDVLSANQNGMAKLPCPKANALTQLFSEGGRRNEDWRVVLDLVELAEMKGVKQVSITMDHRSHGSTSLLHPCLSYAQGPAIVVCLHDVVVEVDELVKLTSPSKFYSSSVSGDGGCGGAGFPRYGSGLCGAFLLGDCLQVLAGGSLIFFDPNGEHFVDGDKQEETSPDDSSPTKLDDTDNARDGTQCVPIGEAEEEKEEDDKDSEIHEDGSSDETAEVAVEAQASTPLPPPPPLVERKPRRGLKATGRNYGISTDFAEQFPDQFEPFLSLPLGVKDALANSSSAGHQPRYRGTIIRIPFRTAESPPSVMCERALKEEDKSSLVKSLQERLSSSFLFTYHLQSINVDEWHATEPCPKVVLRSRVSSSPIARRSHIDEMTCSDDWKKSGSKLKKLFTSSWVPERSSYTLQITRRHGQSTEDIIDTFVVSTVLAPPRLREMACTEALKPLQLLPCLTLSAHIHSTQGGKVLGTNTFTPPRGALFVGLDTGIETGLPFNVNAPLFLHEMTGDVMLRKEDDLEFRKMYPGIRNILVPGKSGGSPETKSLALYVWNAQALTSAVKEVVPSMLNELRDPIQYMYSRDAKLLYRFWPFYSRIQPAFKKLIPDAMWAELARSSIFLTNQDGFQAVGEGYFASPDYPVSGIAAKFFQEKVSLFQVPHRIVEDLSRVGVETKQLTPTLVRKILKQGRCAQWLSHRPKEALALLKYCLSDVGSVDSFVGDDPAVAKCKRELQGLCLIPLSDGTVGTLGRSLILANTAQQGMLPSLKSKFCSPALLQGLESFLSRPGSLGFLGITKFGPHTLASHISTVLPSSWEGRDFVIWNPERREASEVFSDQLSGPSKVWLYQFWKEVPIWNHDIVQMFRRWPLIPTKNGELASCGNARFILYFCPSGVDDALRESIVDEHARIEEGIEEAARHSLIREAAESRATDTHDAETSDADATFWGMGREDEDTNTDNAISDPNREGQAIEEDDEGGNAPNVVPSEEGLKHDGPEQDPPPVENDPALVPDPPQSSTVEASAFAREADSASIKSLHSILSEIRCPLLESAYFSHDDAAKILPADRLGMSRSILATLSHCTNYWTAYGPGASEPRLLWSSVEPSSQLDELILLLSQHHGTRLSLMTSDLSMLRQLPLFETLSHARVALPDRDDNFTVDTSVDLEGLSHYLPDSLRSKFLADKPSLRGLYEDLGVQPMNEANILQKFVLPEFATMPLAQKEAVCQTILVKWGVLGGSTEFVETLKGVPFVKRKSAENGETLFVKASQLVDPRNDLMAEIFDTDRSSFPAEEFARDEWLSILSQVGLKNNVDRDALLKAAYQVELEQSTSKAMTLLAYYKEHFSEFFDTNNEFSRQISAVKCVPAEFDGGLALYHFQDVAVPKDRHIVFKILPVMPESVSPPQVMFSSLGIVSPPTLSSVLKQLKILTDNDGVLDHWHYKHGTVDEVWNHLFSFLQENWERVSPLVQNGLRDRPLVPVGTTLVKAKQLFFRLAKDLAPFFYEVPRVLGPYDRLLRELGVRDSPKPEDYACSLMDLKHDTGGRLLNVNELKSCVDVVTLVVDESKTAGSSIQNQMVAPDITGSLVDVESLLQNDCPWLVNSGRLDTKRVHLSHPKLTVDLCKQLGIKRLSECVTEVLEDGFTPNDAHDSSTDLSRIQENLCSDEFIGTMVKLVGNRRNGNINTLKGFKVYEVEKLRTRFILSERRDDVGIDITRDPTGSFCYISGEKVYVSKLPAGLNPELVIASAVCDFWGVDRKHVAGLSVMLASDNASMSQIGRSMGLVASEEHAELRRGEPGYPLVDTDLKLVELKPLKIFNQGEIVAIKKKRKPEQLVYGVVVEHGGGTSLSRVRLRAGEGEPLMLLSSDIYSFKKASGGAEGIAAPNSEPRHVDMTMFRGRNQRGAVASGDQEADLEATLTTSDDNDDAASSDAAPVNRNEVLGAVEDLLEAAGLSLSDDMKNTMDSNLELRDKLSQKDVHINSLLNEGKNLSNDLSKGMDTFLCPITREPMEDPVICADGHTYERAAIETWLRSNSRSPKTNQQLSSRVLIPNHALRSTIETMSESMKAVQRFSDTFH